MLKPYALIVVVLAVLISCSPSKKAHEYFSKHPNEFATDCNDAFPVKESTDSSGFKQSLFRIDSLTATIDQTKQDYDLAIDILKDNIADLQERAPRECDSLTDAIYRYAATQSKRADESENKVRQLSQAIKNSQPVEVVRENTARVKALEQQLQLCSDAGLQESREKDFWKKKYEDLDAKGKGNMVLYIPWWLIILLAAFAGGGIMAGIKKSLNPLTWFSNKQS